MKYIFLISCILIKALPSHAEGINFSKLQPTYALASKTDTVGKQINWDDLNPRAVGFVKDYLLLHESRLEKMKSWGLPYFLMIDQILNRYHLPTTLKYLAVIESDLQSNALSVAGAVGPWQLMPETARELGLTVNNRIDERTDLNKSTHAAARFLTTLYEQLGDWLLVVAAYNGGPARVENIIKKKNSRDFWVIQNALPAESRTHVKKFIATHYIFEKDGSETTGKIVQAKPAYVLSPEEIILTDTIVVSGKYNGMVIAKTLGIDIAQFNKWNPAFDQKVANEHYALRLYKDKLDLFRVKHTQILQESVLMMMQQNLQYGNGFPDPVYEPAKPAKTVKKAAIKK